MKRISNRILRLPIQIKLFKNGKEYLATTVHRKSQVYLRTEPKLWHKAYLRVTYGKGLTNSGWYTTLTDFKKALSAFTEKGLLDYLEDERR